jgi:uncharacterized damage-inducible protein DinB
MEINISSIQNPQVRTFYALYWSQHQILREFYNRLAEEQYDLRMVDTPRRRSDSPRESLAHILYVQWVYLNGVKTGKLEFKSMGTEHYRDLPKAQLLDEWERVDREIYQTLNARGFDSSCLVEVPWGGQMNAVDVLFFLRDHDILHIGWNLALMDAVDLPRYESLIRYWGP